MFPKNVVSFSNFHKIKSPSLLEDSITLTSSNNSRLYPIQFINTEEYKWLMQYQPRVKKTSSRFTCHVVFWEENERIIRHCHSGICLHDILPALESISFKADLICFIFHRSPSCGESVLTFFNVLVIWSDPITNSDGLWDRLRFFKCWEL